jgi:ADP-ribose pyrophosphatase YjhB (NUDIX family)
MDTKHAHCSWCGSAFATGAPWPRTCSACCRISYRNPIPVVVLLQPINDGLVCVRRGIPLGLGQLALPGGFLDVNETWQEGAARELREETGLVIDPSEITVFDVLSPAPPEALVLLFGLARPRGQSDIAGFCPNEEVTELAAIRGPTELAFPLHTRVVHRYFAR